MSTSEEPSASRSPATNDASGAGRSGAKRPGVLAWLAALVAALLAAGAAWLLGETGAFRIAPASVNYSMMGTPVNGPTQATHQAAAVKSAALAYGAFGALLGLAIGLAGGLAAGSPRRAGVAAVAGAFAGCLAGGGASLVILPAYVRWVGDSLGDPLPTMAMHGLIWSPLGAAAGLALGIGRGGGRGLGGAVAGGVVGAVLGTVVYDLLGAFAFPMAETGLPVSETALTRFLNLALLALPIAAGAVWGGRPTGPAPPAAAVSAGG